MSALERVRIIQAHLQAISRAGPPTSDIVGVWVKELERIPLRVLDDRIQQARQEHSEKLEKGKGWGHITPDDVLAIQRRLRRGSGTANEPVENPECPLRCSLGRLTLTCPDGYDICVRCSCSAGDWWMQNPVYKKQHNAQELLDLGYQRPT
jgi:hypothetical protein